VSTAPGHHDDGSHSHPETVAHLTHLVASVLAPAAALSGDDGQIRPVGAQGVFVGDERVLSRARLRVGGAEPAPLAAFIEGPGVTRFLGVAAGAGDPGPDPTVRVSRTRRVSSTGMAEEIRLESHATTAVRTTVSVDLGPDGSAMDLVKAGRAADEGQRLVESRPSLDGPHSGATELFWRTESSEVRVGGVGAVLGTDPASLLWTVDLPPRGQVALDWSVTVTQHRAVVVAAHGPVEWARPVVESADPRLSRLLERSLADLESLRLADVDSPHDTFVAAGVPWFMTLFGRDSLWCARMLLPLGTGLAAGTLRTLARRQGRRVDPLTGEAPGKIMHELRVDGFRLDGARRLPATYYGTVDATLLWISLLHDAWRWGMPEAEVAALLPTLDAALSWLAEHADADGDGFVEYVDRTGTGLANQGWKDSGDAIKFHNGQLAAPPIALCEVQGYAHRAALDAAAMLEWFGRPDAARWQEYAADLAARFRERFWADGPLGRFPVLALDGGKRQVDALTSNIGHLLGTGLLDADETRTVVRLLAQPALSDGYGLRTMSTLDGGFNPLSYHCGSVWPHDTAIALLGLTRCGLRDESVTVACGLLGSGLLAAAESTDYRLPELYGGDPRRAVSRPVPYPSACRPQGWAAAAAVVVAQAALGLWADVPGGELRVAPPDGVPLGALALRGVRAGDARIDVEVGPDGAVRVSSVPSWLRVAGPERPGTRLGSDMDRYR
jgi:glycogen debranching enzyme